MNRRTLAEVEGFLVAEGLCSACHQWLVIPPPTSGLPNHHQQGEKCKNSGYSPREWRFKATNAADALKLAQVLSEDKGECLSHWAGGHSMACGDGRQCHETRRRLAKALADFVLQTVRADAHIVETGQ